MPLLQGEHPDPLDRGEEGRDLREQPGLHRVRDPEEAERGPSQEDDEEDRRRHDASQARAHRTRSRRSRSAARPGRRAAPRHVDVDERRGLVGQEALPALVVERLLVELEHRRLGVAGLDHDVAELGRGQRREPLRVARASRASSRRADRGPGSPRRRATRPAPSALGSLLVPGADEVHAADGRPVVVVLEVPVDGERRRSEEGVPVPAAERAALEESEAELLDARREAPVAGELLDLRLDRVDGLEDDLDLPQDVSGVDVRELRLDALDERR